MTTAEEISTCLKSLRTCRICSEICRNPKTLECMHSFCLECLKTCLTGETEQDSFSCPQCKLKVVPPPGIPVDSSYLESLGSSSLFAEETLRCRDHPDNKCAFYLTETWEPVCEVCRRTRPSSCVPIDSKNSIQSRNSILKELDKTVASTKHDIFELCQSLSSRERKFHSMKDDLMLGILKYFGDLKSKILEYLTKHEEEILDKLNNFIAHEMTGIRQNTDFCFSFLDSLSSTFYMSDRKFDQADDENALFGYQGLAQLKEYLNDYTSKVSILNETISDEKEIRFIINTEFEDTLTEGDLVNVELLSSRVRSSGSVQRAYEQSDTTIIEGVPMRGGRTTTPAVTISPPIANQRTDYDNNEPPPPYPGLSSPGQAQYVYRTQDTPSNTDGRPFPTAPTLDEFIEVPTVPRQLTHGNSFESQLSTVSNENHTFCFRPLVQFTSRVQGNELMPVMSDLCWVNKKVLVADKKNKCLKIFSTRGSCIRQFLLEEEPHGCVAYQDLHFRSRIQFKVAVTFPKVNKVSVYSINTEEGYSVTLETEYKTRIGYTCITYYEPRQYFIGSTTMPFSFPLIDVLQIEPDDVLGIVDSIKDYNGTPFGYPRYVTVNAEGIIALSDYKTRKVFYFDLQGRCVGMFDGSRSRNLQDPQGIGVFDNLFIIADTKRNNVFCVDSDSNVIGEMHPHDLLERTPRFISISTSQQPLMAIGHGSGTISLYDVWREYVPSAPDCGSYV